MHLMRLTEALTGAALFIIAALTEAPPPSGSTDKDQSATNIEVAVTNVRNSKGVVRTALCLLSESLSSRRGGRQGRQRLDDPALGDDAVSALADNLAQLVPECCQVGNFALYLGQVSAGDQVDFLARPILLIRQAQRSRT